MGKDMGQAGATSINQRSWWGGGAGSKDGRLLIALSGAPFAYNYPVSKICMSNMLYIEGSEQMNQILLV
jgi:hypothetical protein